jgi:S1-C subfamily serine protease
MRSACSYLIVALLAAGITYTVGRVTLPAAVHVETGSAVHAQEAPPALPTERDLAELAPDEQANVRVYQQANRSVVNIMTRALQADDLEFFLFGGAREGTGSGSVLDKQGHILTNFHVIEDARQITVTLFDGSSYEGKVVGHDRNNDLAVLQIEAPADRLFPIPWGDSTKLLVGMRVYAIGNPFGLDRTLTTGIVSSLNRTLRTENKRVVRGVIQTDAAINPGNSGGPLLNRRGELVGITTAIVSRAGQSSGVGLAIPSSMARRVVGELVRFGHVMRADCGIFAVYELEKGLLVARLIPGGPAEQAKLRGPQITTVNRGGFILRTMDRSKADLIVAVDGKPVHTFDDLLTHVESKKPGDKVVLRIIREGDELDVPVTLQQARE